jgi:hypothetical protein
MSIFSAEDADLFYDMQECLKMAPVYRKDERAADFCDRYVEWYRSQRTPLIARIE